MIDQETRDAIVEAVEAGIREYIELPEDYSLRKAHKLLHIRYAKLKDMIVADEIRLNALGRVPKSEIERLLGESIPLEKYLPGVIGNHPGRSVKQ